MKKSLVALAVLAASGAAMAQSSVTLYGRLDVGFGQTSTEASGAVPKEKLTQTVVSSSNLNTTFWGLKGSEDLGGGLRANFDLQQQFSVDTGAAANTLFERRAVVGFSGGFGAVNLGRQYTAYDDIRGGTDMIWDYNFAVSGAGGLWKTGVADYNNRIANSIRFDSANYGGFSGAVAYGLGENKNTATNVGDATDSISLNIKYANGPLLVGYAHQEDKLAQASVAVAQVTNKYDLIGGSYDFGVAKLTGSFNKAKNGTRDDDEYQVGVSAPISDAISVGIGYAHAKSTGSGLAELIGKGYAMVGTYNLSKRSTLYAGYKSMEVETGATGAITNTKDTSFAFGVRHLF